MKIIKYETESNDFCLVHKTKMFVYYLLFKNNKYHYFESYTCKKQKKTKKISFKLLKQKIIKTSINHYDDFILSYKADNYLSNINNDYHLVSETFGNDNYVTLCVIDNNLQKIKEFQGQKYSPTFIFSYILYKFNFNFSLGFHSFGELFIGEISKRDKLKIKKYVDLMFYKYINYKFEDINIDYKYFMQSMNERYLFNCFFHYDKIINVNIDKIIQSFNLFDNHKKISYVYYGMCYFSCLFFIDFIKKNNIKNSKISINSCLFKIKICESFFNDTNTYFFSTFNNLKNGWIFFIDDKYNQHINLIKNKHSKKMFKGVKKIIL